MAEIRLDTFVDPALIAEGVGEVRERLINVYLDAGQLAYRPWASSPPAANWRRESGSGSGRQVPSGV